jgi:hypothetical protein
MNFYYRQRIAEHSAKAASNGETCPKIHQTGLKSARRFEKRTKLRLQQGWY